MCPQINANALFVHCGEQHTDIFLLFACICVHSRTQVLKFLRMTTLLLVPSQSVIQ